jgi:FAD/FMN-containing dehydrogenase
MVPVIETDNGRPIAADRVEHFTHLFHGPVLVPGDAAYDAARRVFNGMVDRRPALVVQPLDAADVQLVVRFARQNQLRVSVRGGGHSAPGHAVCDRGVMIDLSRLKAIQVDPVGATATAEGGVTWGEFDAATQVHGLAVTGGRIRGTGIGGLTLGSGSGWLERKLGFTVDNLLGAEVVLATGEIVQADSEQHPDLFWGLRGGGGNFGIVTRFRYQLHRIGPTIFGGMLLFDRTQAGGVFRVYRDFMERASDDVGGGLVFITAPPAPFVPEGMRAKPALAILVCYTGDPASGEGAIASLLALNPAVRLVQPMPYVDIQGLLEDANPPGLRNYWKAHMCPELPDEALDRLVTAAAAPRSPFTTILVQPFGGRIARIADDATAMGWRGAKWSVHVLGMWADAREDTDQMAWVRNVADAMNPWSQHGAYLNYLMDEGEDRVKDSFGAHYARMVALKNKYDPTNFFCLNQNVKPTV